MAETLASISLNCLFCSSCSICTVIFINRRFHTPCFNVFSLSTFQMGFVQSKVLKRPKKYRARILMLGLDSTGKTTLLYNMITGEELSTIPTMGFNVEELSHPNKKFTLDIWDIGGQKSIRRLWRHYYLGAQV